MKEQSFTTKQHLILYFLRGAKRYYLLSACFAALVSLLDMLSPRLISFTVDYVAGNAVPPSNGLAGILTDLGGGISQLRANPFRIALAAAMLGIASALCRYCFRLFNAKGAQAFTERMRDELFSHILQLPYRWLAKNRTGDLIQRCTSDVETIRRFVSEQLTALVRTLLLIGMALYFMSGIHVGMMLISAAFIPVTVGYSLFFYSRIAGAFETVDVEEGVLSAIAQENLTGVRVVRAFGREEYERTRFEKQNEYYTGRWIHLFRLLSAFWASGDVLTGLQAMTMVVLGACLCIRGSLTAGGYIAFISYTIMLTWPVRSLGRVISEMSKAGISVERLRDIMNAAPETDHPQAQRAPMDRDIVFEHVTFSYEGKREHAEPNTEAGAESVRERSAEAGARLGKERSAEAGAGSGKERGAEAGAGSGAESRTDSGDVLHDVSFTVPAGSTVGILGGTGSGKSTLLYLLERLYELPEENGRILIGGVDIARLPLAYLRANIGFVLQEPFLFSRTIGENIAIGTEQADEASIREAAAIACIGEAIAAFPDGYETVVGERGVTLSGGQKQRTAIAQMLVRKPPIMIFDDSLSAVDAKTDARIRQALKEHTGSSTVFLVAHRITTLMHADQIIVMDRGRVRESGTHEQLMKAGGLYRRIYDLQTAGLEEADL